jgi:hypothetical protein
VNPRATLALLFAALVLVGALAYLRLNVPATRDAAERKRYAAVFDPESVAALDLVRGDETLSFVRENGEWRLASPVADRASPEAVDRLLLAARFLEVRDRESGIDPAAMPDTGLATPRLRLDLRGSEDIRIDLGAATALPGEIFARVGGERAVLRVPDSIVELATAPAATFRDPRLTMLVAEDIEKFTVRRADGEMTLRIERGRWIIEKPVRSPADPRAVRAFLEPLLGLRITGFEPSGPSPDAPAPLPGDSAAVSLTPRGGGEALELQVARPAAGTPSPPAATLAPRGTFQVDPSALRIFDVSPESLRDRTLGFVDADSVDRIRISSDGNTLTFRRSGDTWTAEETARTITTAEASKLIDTFNAARVASFRTTSTPAETGLDQPGRRVEFLAWLSENSAEEPAGANLIAGAALGKPAADGTIYARAAGSDETVTINSDLAAGIDRITAAPASP